MNEAQRDEKFWSKVEKSDGCWIWKGCKSQDGYGQLMREKLYRSHRYSWIIHFGKIPDGMCVCHHCDNPSCVRPDHLFLGNVLINTRDMIRKGRSQFTKNLKYAMKSPDRIKNLPRGEDCSWSKMNKNKVLEARRLYSEGLSIAELARRFRLTPTPMNKIINRKSWKNV